ncbi:uncharacterized protein LOC122756519 [Drosophila santomea]|uniref:uncharacterized protein LOC122756519 n=1 Tax=Drosophila santomea TaxID=129105 RepID=UPI001CCFEC6A|nr:uncharacterized protein LOC122756519 [Drosophila santomea]
MNLKELRRSLGIASWYRRLVPNFADVVELMTALLKKDRKWEWTTRQEQAFQDLKDLVTEAPVLACPDFEETFTLQTDASDYGIGVVLIQTIEGQERVTEKECLAIVWSVRKMRCYFEEVTSVRELQQFQYDVKYRRGAQNLVADALLRQPLATVCQAQVQDNSCKWINKMMRKIDQEPTNYPDFREENRHLYRRIGLRPEEEDYTPWKLCVGTNHRGLVLEECHDHPTAGHLGVRKTWPKGTTGPDFSESRFGVPKILVCYNGEQFTSRGVRALCKSLGIELQHTAPYTPRQNPTKRANRTVKTMIAQYLGETPQNTWDQLLPEISLADESHAFPKPGRGTALVPPEEKSRQLHNIFQVARGNAERATAEQGRHLRRRQGPPHRTPSDNHRVSEELPVNTCGHIALSLEQAPNSTIWHHQRCH